MKKIIKQKIKDSNNKKSYGGYDYTTRMNFIQSKRKKNIENNEIINNLRKENKEKEEK